MRHPRFVVGMSYIAAPHPLRTRCQCLLVYLCCRACWFAFPLPSVARNQSALLRAVSRPMETASAQQPPARRLVSVWPVSRHLSSRRHLCFDSALVMASHHSPTGSKRPRLSLQIKTSSASSSSTVDASDPTSFNTLSNAYVAAVERSSSAMLSEPITAINTLQAFTLATPAEYKNAKSRIVTPYIASFPETPLTAHRPGSPSQLQLPLPSTMTATPPLSAETPDSAPSTMFTFSSSGFPSPQARDRFGRSPVDGPTLRRRAVPYLSAELGSHLPYSHPRSLHSILRNSPLPPRTAIPPPSPRRQSLRLQEKAAKKVGYNSPLTQEIVTNKYTKSHIELLGEDASPGTPCPPAESNKPMNMPLAFTDNEVQDGGQTPNPFGDVRRTLAAAGAETLSAVEPNGARKRKRTEKRRQWVWTIGLDDEDEAADEGATARPDEVDGASSGCAQAHAVDTPGFRYLETPTPSVESASSAVESVDVSMSDACSVGSSEEGLSELDPLDETELDPKTPVAPVQPGEGRGRQRNRQRDTPIPELCGKGDTPVSSELK